MKILTACLLGSVLTFSSHTYAAPIDFIDNGNYTTDTKSGLDWLDVTLSVNQSYNYVSSQFGVGGEYEGWRYATGIEFNTMVSNFTDESHTPSDFSLRIHEEGKIDALVGFLGSTLDAYFLPAFGETYDASYGYPEGEGMDYTYGLLLDLDPTGNHYLAIILDDDRTFDHPDTSDIYGSNNLPDYAIYNIGSYLVRDTIPTVPVPAAAFMFAPALLGFLGLRRKRRA
jgi:hypothetical protein